MLYNALKPLLFSRDAERVHDEAAGLLALMSPIPGAKTALYWASGRTRPGLEKTVFGLRFPNPVGLAAGFDKDGKLAGILPSFGFGFIEIGSVTLEPQPGNPRPRMFRQPEQRGLINRMGFNSEGARAVARRLANSPRPNVPLGINIGLNKGTPAADAPAHYARCFRMLASHGDYFTVNVSSPNTPGLRDLQKAADLEAILASIGEANTTGKPVLVKLSPDLSPEDLEACVGAAQRLAAGLIVANTTISREGVPDRWMSEAGGLSGAPLKTRALDMLKRTRALTRLPIIGVGGIETAQDAAERLAAGADLLQLYTGFIYGGPTSVKAILRGLERPA